MAALLKEESFVKVPGGKIWYEVIGTQKGIPLIVLHGGPGVPHYYIQPLEDLGMDREVVLYDQLGCGKSDNPDDISLWNVDRFVQELEALRKHLGFEKVHLLGHSWGAALAAEYYFIFAKHVQSIIFADPFLSAKIWMKDAKRLLATLPKDVQIKINVHQNSGTYDSEEYKLATQDYYDLYLNRGEKPNPYIEKAKTEFGAQVYRTMWGPTEFHVTGNLMDYDFTSKLPEIKVPVLILCGKYDEATPQSCEYFQEQIPGSEMIIFENSAHHPHLEETEKYLDIVGDYLNRTDKDQDLFNKNL